MAKATKKWHEHVFSATTTKNMLQMCAQTCMRCMRWPPGIPFMVRAQQEECVELHFARIKAPFAGVSPTWKNALLTHSSEALLGLNGTLVPARIIVFKFISLEVP